MKTVKKRFVCQGNSEDCISFFENHRAQMRKIINFTCFFDQENYLLTRYASEYHPGIGAILEDEEGNEMLLDNLSVGYVGEGPRASSEVLKRLDFEDAEELVQYNGICIRNGILDRKASNPFFSSKNKICGCQVSGTTKIIVPDRKVLMLNPQYYNLNGLLNLLHIMNPISVTYAYGNHAKSVALSDCGASVYFEHTYISPYIVQQKANLLINGKNFDIICFIEQRALLSTVDTLLSYLLKKPYWVLDISSDEKLITDSNFNGWKIFCKSPQKSDAFKKTISLKGSKLEQWTVFYN